VIQSEIDVKYIIVEQNYRFLIDDGLIHYALIILETAVEHGFCGKSGRERQRIARREWP